MIGCTNIQTELLLSRVFGENNHMRALRARGRSAPALSVHFDLVLFTKSTNHYYAPAKPSVKKSSQNFLFTDAKHSLGKTATMRFAHK